MFELRGDTSWKIGSTLRSRSSSPFLFRFVAKFFVYFGNDLCLDKQRSSLCLITFCIKLSLIEAICEWMFSNLIKKIIQTLIRNMLNV